MKHKLNRICFEFIIENFEYENLIKMGMLFEKPNKRL